MDTLKRYLQLPFTKQRLLIESMLILVMVRVGLWLLPFATLNRLLQKFEQRAQGRKSANDNYQDEISWAVSRMSRILSNENVCLFVALVGQLHLNLHGFPARTRFGVQKTINDELKAHAWVECNGNVVIGGSKQEIENYTALSD
jgi:hypothetical protein